MLPMSELNTSQQKIADTLEGMIVVDAGPGTGKTHTIVRRYLNLVHRSRNAESRPPADFHAECGDRDGGED